MKERIETLQEELFEQLFCLYNEYSAEKIADISFFYRELSVARPVTSELKRIISLARNVVTCSEMMASGYPDENLDDLLQELKNIKKEIEKLHNNEKKR